MNECAAAEYQRADAELNALWSYAKPSADQMGVGAQLLDAQRKWIAYRDAACTAEAEMFRGGSIQPLVWFQCMTRLTAQRSGDLRNFSN
ncbi:DUF1311 domain-containing protein [Aliishimia ponticola]|uniref:DUF1311 domain-containing protein n=2 Tax=Aliishimia ponticola TaxID=2499833 RepID=A0A4S4NDW8_9RHOB|nr:DUF1311 domain-containing protein [Aliishimia ponticola]